MHSRVLICLLVATAMTFASIASAWAVSVNIGREFGPHQMPVSQEATMPDCDRMAQTAKTDVPDGKHGSSADNFCMAKCFKVFSSLYLDELAAIGANALPSFLTHDPAIWFDRPPFAPPRS
jgi:hypothetical protein